MSLNDDHVDPYDPAQLTALLRWYAEMGVDMAVEATPRDRFAENAVELARAAAKKEQRAVAAPREAPTPPSIAPSKAAPRLAAPALKPTRDADALSNDAVAQSARELAGAAKNLEELRATLEAFDGCALKRTASRLVFADGDPASRLMFVGEGPGGDEDRQGLPFVGRAGQLLNRMLAAIGLERAQVYIANVVPWRPPGNRNPTPQETAICLPFIRRQIALANPDVLICLGAISTQALLGVREGITKSRGNWRDYTMELDSGDRVIRALPMLHPAYLLRTPIAKRQTWSDLRAVKRTLSQT